MYETLKNLFERLHDTTDRWNDPAAPTSPELQSQPEVANWNQDRDAAMAYRMYYTQRSLGKTHEQAVEYCKKHA